MYIWSPRRRCCTYICTYIRLRKSSLKLHALPDRGSRIVSYRFSRLAVNLVKSRAVFPRPFFRLSRLCAHLIISAARWDEAARRGEGDGITRRQGVPQSNEYNGTLRAPHRNSRYVLFSMYVIRTYTYGCRYVSMQVLLRGPVSSRSAHKRGNYVWIASGEIRV